MKIYPNVLGSGITELDTDSVAIDISFSWLPASDIPPDCIMCSIAGDDVLRILAEKHRTGHYNLFLRVNPFPPENASSLAYPEERAEIAAMLRHAADQWERLR